MSSLVTSTSLRCTSPQSVKEGVVSQGSLGQRSVIVIMTEEQFSQYCVQDRIQKLTFYSSKEIHGLTDSGKKHIIHANWPIFDSQEHFEGYLANAYVKITQMDNGDYQLRAFVRGQGGGNSATAPKQNKSNKPAANPAPPAPQIKHYSSYAMNKALQSGNYTSALQMIETIIPSDDIDESDLYKPINLNWTAGVAKMIQKKGLKLTAKVFNTPFYNNSKDMIKCLIDNGAPLNDGSLVTCPLTESVQKGWPDIVQYMLQKGANPNGYGSGMSPLEEACSSYSRSKRDSQAMKSIAKLLLSAGAIGRCSPQGADIALNGAVVYGWADIVSFMFEKGFIIDPSCLPNAVFYEKVEVIPILIAHGANPQDPEIQKRFQTIKPEIQQLLTSPIKESAEFSSMIKSLSIKIIRLLQGGLYGQVETAQKLGELENILIKALSSSSALREFLLRKNAESEIAARRQALIDYVSKKLNELIGSSFYFDPKRNALRTIEIEQELKEAILAWDASDSSKISLQQNAERDKIKQREILQEQMELKKKEIEQQRGIAEAQLRALHQYGEARKKEAEDLQSRIDALRAEARRLQY